MRLKISAASANERLVTLVNLGYEERKAIRVDYTARKGQVIYKKDDDIPRYRGSLSGWGGKVIQALNEIFPTERESNIFQNPEVPLGIVSGDYEFESLDRYFLEVIRGLDTIRQTSIPQYTDLPLAERLYVEDIESFQKVRDVNPVMVTNFLNDGFLDWTEDAIQIALEQILEVAFHKKDWAGETNDLYTANVFVNGARRAAAFVLKGPGIGKKSMTIADCGKNGDQLVRLFQSSADLYVVQYVGPISENLIADVEGKTREKRAASKHVNFLIMDGQDTARVLRAYGKL